MVRPRAANWIEPMKIKLLVLIPMLMTAVTFSQTVFAKDAEAYGAAMIKQTNVITGNDSTHYVSQYLGLCNTTVTSKP